MEWKFVDSSNLRAFRYDKTSASMDVQFKNGFIYRYNQVPMSVAKQMESATSVGSFFAQNVKGMYDYDRLA